MEDSGIDSGDKSYLRNFGSDHTMVGKSIILLVNNL